VEAGSDWPDRDEWDLPASYGEDSVSVLVRDPWWMFVSWELRDETRAQAREEAGDGATFVVRLLQAGDEEDVLTEVEVPDIPVGDWYVQAHAPRQEIHASLGFLDLEGNFFPVLGSTEVPVPAFEPVPPLTPHAPDPEVESAPAPSPDSTGGPLLSIPKEEDRPVEDLLFEFSGGRELEDAARWRKGRTKPVIWRRRKFGGWWSVRGEGSGSGSGMGGEWQWEAEEIPLEEEVAPGQGMPSSPSGPLPSSPIGPVSSPSSPFGKRDWPWNGRPDPEAGDSE
jgi:hypothetical protein